MEEVRARKGLSESWRGHGGDEGFLLAVTCTEPRAMPSTLRPPVSPPPSSVKRHHVSPCGAQCPRPTPGSPSRHHCAPRPWCTRTHRPPTVCLGSQPPTCHRAVPPSYPLPPVSGRQLQLCPLLSEQVDSDAQSHKPWVGMRFFFVSLSLSSPPFCPLPLYSIFPLPSGPPAPHVPPLSLLCPAYTPKFPK